jgi:hypothetical protein
LVVKMSEDLFGYFLLTGPGPTQIGDIHEFDYVISAKALVRLYRRLQIDEFLVRTRLHGTAQGKQFQAIEASIFRQTPQFTRRGRCNGVVSRETRMRSRSECNIWFGGSTSDTSTARCHSTQQRDVKSPLC